MAKQYLTPTDMQNLHNLIHEYQIATNFGAVSTKHSNFLAFKMFGLFDRLIKGIIYSSKYQFFRFFKNDIDDLIQEGRSAILKSINKDEYNKDVTKLFNFYSTVVFWALSNYTKKQNRDYPQDLFLFEFLDLMPNKNYYVQTHDLEIVIEALCSELRVFFEGMEKYLQLLQIFQQYLLINRYGKLKKKDFIQFAQAHNFSSSFVNTFFKQLKKIPFQQKEILHLFEAL